MHQNLKTCLLISESLSLSSDYHPGKKCWNCSWVIKLKNWLSCESSNDAGCERVQERFGHSVNVTRFDCLSYIKTGWQNFLKWPSRWSGCSTPNSRTSITGTFSIRSKILWTVLMLPFFRSGILVMPEFPWSLLLQFICTTNFVYQIFNFRFAHISLMFWNVIGWYSIPTCSIDLGCLCTFCTLFVVMMLKVLYCCHLVFCRFVRSVFWIFFFYFLYRQCL